MPLNHANESLGEKFNAFFLPHNLSEHGFVNATGSKNMKGKVVLRGQNKREGSGFIYRGGHKGTYSVRDGILAFVDPQEGLYWMGFNTPEKKELLEANGIRHDDSWSPVEMPDNWEQERSGLNETISTQLKNFNFRLINGCEWEYLSELGGNYNLDSVDNVIFVQDFNCVDWVGPHSQRAIDFLEQQGFQERKKYLGLHPSDENKKAVFAVISKLKSRGIRDAANRATQL